MNPNDEQQLWLDVLAGKAQPTDRATRQAARLRQILIQQRAQDRQRAPDPAGEQRLLARLHASAPTPAPAKPANPAKPAKQGWLAGLHQAIQQHWGFSGMVMAAFVVVVILPALQQHPDQPDQSGWSGPTTKSVPLPTGTPSSPGTTPAEGEYRSANPSGDSVRLAAILQKAGVAATREQQGDSYLVQARIAPERLAKVNDTLATQFGIAAPASGVLVVRFKKLQ